MNIVHLRIGGEMYLNSNVTSKEELMQKAKEIISLEGAEKLSIRKLAEKCNISVGVFYNYFPNKTELLFAIVTEFWSSMYVDSISYKDFLEYTERFYNRLIDKLSEFENGWLTQLSILNLADKERGRQMERECFHKMKSEMLQVLSTDERISEDVWSSTFTKEEFISFVFQNIMACIRKEQRDCTTLIKVLERVLY